MKKLLLGLFTAVVLLTPLVAYAGGVNIGDINRLTGVSVSSWTINSSSIGATTPSTGAFTTETATTATATINNAGSSGVAGTINIFPATAANGKIILSATNDTGGFTSTITNANVGQNTVYTIADPGAATGNIVVDTATQTLTNKTLTSPKITGPVAVACGSTCTLGTANLGTYTRLDTAGGSAATLPAATGTGNTYKLYISVATTSAQDKILLATVTDTIIGTATGENAGTAKVFVGNAGTYHSIQMPFAGSQPSGGFIGDSIVCTDVASTVYKCDIVYQAGTTPTTPYSTSTT